MCWGVTAIGKLRHGGGWGGNRSPTACIGASQLMGKLRHGVGEGGVGRHPCPAVVRSDGGDGEGWKGGALPAPAAICCAPFLAVQLPGPTAGVGD